MCKKILFWPDINYEPGHWRPVMSIANKLKKELQTGCEIKFLCTPECKPIVQSVRKPNFTRLFKDQDIETILEELYPVGYSTLANEKPEEARSRIEHCQKIADGAFDELLENFQPHLLIAGYFISMEALLIKYRYDNVILPKLENVSINDVPPEKKMKNNHYHHVSASPKRRPGNNVVTVFGAPRAGTEFKTDASGAWRNTQKSSI